MEEIDIGELQGDIKDIIDTSNDLLCDLQNAESCETLEDYWDNIQLAINNAEVLLGDLKTQLEKMKVKK